MTSRHEERSSQDTAVKRTGSSPVTPHLKAGQHAAATPASDPEPVPAGLPIASSQALAENSFMADTGCEVSASCLQCGLAKCKYDDPDGFDFTYHERNRRIFELRKAGIPVAEIKRQFKISERTVHRILQNGGERTGKAQSVANQTMPEQMPLIEPDEIKMHNFKLYDAHGPAFNKQGYVLVYSGRCRTPDCGGDVLISLLEKTAQCLQCRRDMKK